MKPRPTKPGKRKEKKSGGAAEPVAEPNGQAAETAEGQPPPSKRKMTPPEIAALNEQARLYPWRMFSLSELVAMMGINDHLMSAVAGHRESPIKAVKKARPEWIITFLQNPPSDFSVK